MTTWKHVENSIFFTLYGLATKKKFKLESLIFMTGFRNCSYVPLVHLNRRFRERFCIKKNYVFIKRSVGLYEWVCLPSQYFTFPCKRERKSKMKGRIWPISCSQSLTFPVYSNSPFIFTSILTFIAKLPQNTPPWSIDLHEKQLCKKCIFLLRIQAPCMCTFVPLISLTKIS